MGAIGGAMGEDWEAEAALVCGWGVGGTTAPSLSSEGEVYASRCV